ncbi:MAG: hypothetical protein J6I50_06325 [Clostridia bacterium]|nr:hypothetical protein [Clostridia bacterium]
MTLTVLSDNPHGGSTPKTRLIGRHNNWFVWGLYKNELKRTWSLGLLFALILFIAIPVANLMACSSNAVFYENHPESLSNFLSDYFDSGNPVITIYAFLGGILCAFVTSEYLFDRRKTNFVCSLPIKRGAYLLTKAAANLTWPVLAWIPASVLMILVALFTSLLQPHLFLILGGLFRIFGAWLCIHLYFWGITLLACCFCGTGVMGGCMLFMLGGYIPIAALSLIAFFELAFETFRSSWYMSNALFTKISGVYRIFYHIADVKSVWFLLGTALLGLLFIAGAVILTMVRKSENAGTPFAFARVRDIVKYLVVGLSSVLGGMLFWVMAEDVWSLFWMIFGVIFAAFVAWMLCNTIFYKTPKMMFTGRRGICVLTACMLAFTIFIHTDPLNFNDYVPSPAMTSNVKLTTYGSTITLKDRDLIRMYNTMAENGYKAHSKYGDAAMEYNNRAELKSTPDMPIVYSYTTVWNTRYLIPIAKYIYVQYSDWITFVKTLTAQQNFAELLLTDSFNALKTEEGRIRNTEESANISCSFDFPLYAVPDRDHDIYAYKDMTCGEMRAILESYQKELSAQGSTALQHSYSGWIRFRIGTSSYSTLPLFDYQTETQQLILDTTEGFYDRNNTMYQKEFTGAKVLHNGETVAELTEEELLSLYRDGVLLFNSEDSKCSFTLLDQDYLIATNYKITETYNYYTYQASADDEMEFSDIPDTEAAPDSIITQDTNTYETTIESRFLLDKVPQKFQVK